MDKDDIHNLERATESLGSNIGYFEDMLHNFSAIVGRFENAIGSFEEQVAKFEEAVEGIPTSIELEIPDDLEIPEPKKKD